MNNYAFNKYAGEFLKLAQIANYQGRVRALMDVGFSKVAAEKVAMELGELLGRQAEMGNLKNLEAVERAAVGMGPAAGAADRVYDVRKAVSDSLDKGRAQAQARELGNILSHEGKTRLPAYLPGDNPLAMKGTATTLQSELSALEQLPKRGRMAGFEAKMKRQKHGPAGKKVLEAYHGAIDAAKARKAQAAQAMAKAEARQAQIAAEALKGGGGRNKLLAAMIAGGALAGGLGGYYATREEPTLLERLQGMVG